MPEEKKGSWRDKPWKEMTPEEQVARYYGTEPHKRTPEDEEAWREVRAKLIFWLEKDKQERQSRE